MTLRNILFLTLFLLSSIIQAKTVLTLKGAVKGSKDGQGYAFKNIPYAKPPVGNLRFKAPRPSAIKLGIINSSKKEIKCAQLGNLFSGTPSDEFGKVVGSEDCLYLNIWTPKNPSRLSDLPVFIWLHGGSNRYGYALDPLYNGASLAEATQSIVVTVNYRLGYFGAFYSPHLKTKNKKDSSGNYTTLDTIMALDWVRNHISRFGGDKSNITVGGQSAGCINVWGLIQSPLAKDKFKRAYCSSGIPNNYPRTVAAGVSQSFIIQALINKTMAKDRSEAEEKLSSMSSKEVSSFLRSLSTEEVLRVPHSAFPVQHISDGHVFSVLGLSALVLGKFNKVEAMFGATEMEGSYFTQFAYLKLNQKQLADIYQNKASIEPIENFVESKEFNSFKDGSESASNLMRELIDYILHITQFHFSKAYRYEFAWQPKTSPWRELYGATHGIELPFMFYNPKLVEETALNFIGNDILSQRGRELSENFLHYLKGFIHSGNPNQEEKKDVPEWKAWSSTRLSPYVLNFGEEKESYSYVYPNPLIGIEAIDILKMLWDIR